MTERFDLEKFRAASDWSPEVPRNPQRTARKKTEPFLKGPIPIAWLAKAAEMGGSSLAVGICLWFQHGVRGGAGPIKVTKAVRRRLGVSPDRLQRGLKGLERAGLIRFDQRGRGHCAVVQILEAPCAHIATSEAAQGHPGGVSRVPLDGLGRTAGGAL